MAEVSLWTQERKVMEKCKCGESLRDFYEVKNKICNKCLGEEYVKAVVLDHLTDKEEHDTDNPT